MTERRLVAGGEVREKRTGLSRYLTENRRL
jgi:hypothetical protein